MRRQITTLQDLAEYFERRALENKRRADKVFGRSDDTSAENCVWYGAKQDTYERAARKVRELMTGRPAIMRARQ